MENKNEMVTISKIEYDYLKEKEMKLEALEQSGVDNWDFYGEAMKLLREWGGKRE